MKDDRCACVLNVEAQNIISAQMQVEIEHAFFMEPGEPIETVVELVVSSTVVRFNALRLAGNCSCNFC